MAYESTETAQPDDVTVPWKGEVAPVESSGRAAAAGARGKRRQEGPALASPDASFATSAAVAGSPKTTAAAERSCARTSQPQAFVTSDACCVHALRLDNVAVGVSSRHDWKDDIANVVLEARDVLVHHLGLHRVNVPRAQCVADAARDLFHAVHRHVVRAIEPRQLVLAQRVAELIALLLPPQRLLARVHV